MTLLFVGELLGAEVSVGATLGASVEVKAGVTCAVLVEAEPDLELLLCSEVVWRVEAWCSEDVDRWVVVEWGADVRASLELAEASVALVEERRELLLASDVVVCVCCNGDVEAEENIEGGDEDGRKLVEVKERCWMPMMVCAVPGASEKTPTPS